jgi:hypothetical protein
MKIFGLKLFQGNENDFILTSEYPELYAEKPVSDQICERPSNLKDQTVSSSSGLFSKDDIVTNLEQKECHSYSDMLIHDKSTSSCSDVNSNTKENLQHSSVLKDGDKLIVKSNSDACIFSATYLSTLTEQFGIEKICHTEFDKDLSLPGSENLKMKSNCLVASFGPQQSSLSTEFNLPEWKCVSPGAHSFSSQSSSEDFRLYLSSSDSNSTLNEIPKIPVPDKFVKKSVHKPEFQAEFHHQNVDHIIPHKTLSCYEFGSQNVMPESLSQGTNKSLLKRHYSTPDLHAAVSCKSFEEISVHSIPKRQKMYDLKNKVQPCESSYEHPCNTITAFPIQPIIEQGMATMDQQVCVCDRIFM